MCGRSTAGLPRADCACCRCGWKTDMRCSTSTARRSCGAICKTGWRGRILSSAGYRCGSCEGCVTDLVRRLRGSAEFPHEIGLFLSYPPEDVRGFIENRAQNFKRAGLWKVYGDEARAEALFRKFKKCTQIYCERWQSGSKMDELAVAV